LMVLLVAGCILVSCGSSSMNIQLAQDSVGLFHVQVGTEQYSSIYSGTDEKFRGATIELEFAKLLQAVHNKLGTVRESSLQNTGVAWFAGQGATVTLVYHTRFRTGRAPNSLYSISRTTRRLCTVITSIPTISSRNKEESIKVGVRVGNDSRPGSHCGSGFSFVEAEPLSFSHSANCSRN